MEKTKRVSIITPCLNGEKFIERYLKSILNQTYKNIELIFINDGSTDRTEEIFKSYIPEFEKKGIKVIYIYKENEGQAKALNDGLKIFTGEYLTWPDSDDILENDSIEKKVKFLDNNLDYGLVRTDAAIVKENNLDDILSQIGNRPNKFEECIFEDLITEKMYVCCGCYMIRTSAFLNVNKNKEIYCSKAGQNWQMLLPITYKYKCGYIDEVLYKYIIRKHSHSHNIIYLKDLLKQCDLHEDILINTINQIQMTDDEKMKYISIIREKYVRKKMNLGLSFKNRTILNDNYEILGSEYKLTKNDKIIFFMGNNELFNLGIRCLRKIKGAIGI